MGIFVPLTLILKQQIHIQDELNPYEVGTTNSVVKIKGKILWRCFVQLVTRHQPYTSTEAKRGLESGVNVQMELSHHINMAI